MIEVEIHLKSKRKPFVFELKNTTEYDQFYQEIMIKDIIKLGPLIFHRDELAYCLQK